MNPQNGSGYVRPSNPKVVKIVIDIREDLITRWGAILIPRFCTDKTNNISIDPSSILLMGFEAEELAVSNKEKIVSVTVESLYLKSIPPVDNIEP